MCDFAQQPFGFGSGHIWRPRRPMPSDSHPPLFTVLRAIFDAVRYGRGPLTPGKETNHTCIPQHLSRPKRPNIA